METTETPIMSEPKNRHVISSVINRSYVREFMLQHAKDTKFHPFTRVSKETLDMIEEATKRAIRNHVSMAPSRGTTL